MILFFVTCVALYYRPYYNGTAIVKFTVASSDYESDNNYKEEAKKVALHTCYGYFFLFHNTTAADT